MKYVRVLRIFEALPPQPCDVALPDLVLLSPLGNQLFCNL